MLKAQSLKALKGLQERLGGRDNGFYIAVYGAELKTGKQVRGDEIAYWSSPVRSGSYRLIKGKCFK